MKLVVESEAYGTRIGLLDDGRLVEYHAERAQSSRSSRVGDVYLGRVRRLAPAIDAAFVDIGLERNAFLHTTDFNLADGETLDVHQPIVVQAFRDALPGKGVRVRRGATLPGRHVVLVAPGREVAISTRIVDEAERERLKEMVEPFVADGVGWIVRTAALGEDGTTVAADAEELLDLWREIEGRAGSTRPPARLHSDLGPVERWLRDRARDDFEEIWVEPGEAEELTRETLRRIAPELESRIRRNEEATPLFEQFDLERQVEAILKPRVDLQSGGSLVIESTEALVAIDVNSGNDLGGATLEETALATNLEAVAEVARQLRLRDLAGIIVVDFIDLQAAADWERVVERLEEELARDKAATQVEGPIAFGLVAMTRKRGRNDLLRRLTERCGRCGGTGRVRSPAETAAAAARALRVEESRRPGRAWRLAFAVPPEGRPEEPTVTALRERFGDRLSIDQSPLLVDGTFTLEERNG